MERVNSVQIRVEIDTNKETYEGTFDDIHDFIEWWNEHEEVHGSPIRTDDSDE